MERPRLITPYSHSREHPNVHAPTLTHVLGYFKTSHANTHAHTQYLSLPTPLSGAAVLPRRDGGSGDHDRDGNVQADVSAFGAGRGTRRRPTLRAMEQSTLHERGTLSPLSLSLSLSLSLFFSRFSLRVI